MSSFNDVSRGFVNAPPQFARNAWTSYRNTAFHVSYHLSTSELLLFARLARLNLVVTTHRRQHVRIQGSVLSPGALEPIVYVSLEDNGHGAVRGHFERVWPVRDIHVLREVFENTRAEEVARAQAKREADDVARRAAAEAARAEEKKEEEVMAQRRAEAANESVRRRLTGKKSSIPSFDVRRGGARE